MQHELVQWSIALIQGSTRHADIDSHDLIMLYVLLSNVGE